MTSHTRMPAILFDHGSNEHLSDLALVIHSYSRSLAEQGCSALAWRSAKSALARRIAPDPAKHRIAVQNEVLELALDGEPYDERWNRVISEARAVRLLFAIEYANVGATKVIGFHLRPGSILSFLQEESEAEMRAQIMLDPDLPGHDRLEEIVALKQEFGHLIRLEDIA